MPVYQKGYVFEFKQQVIDVLGYLGKKLSQGVIVILQHIVDRIYADVQKELGAVVVNFVIYQNEKGNIAFDFNLDKIPNQAMVNTKAFLASIERDKWVSDVSIDLRNRKLVLSTKKKFS